MRNTLKPDKKIAFVSGTFNVVHPGHIRLLNFAADCADYLIVGVNPDGYQNVFVSQDVRLESVKAINLVDHAFILPVAVEQFIAHLKPEIVVKGKEHESLFNIEKTIIEEYGGKLLFAAGETWFSSLNQLKKQLQKVNLSFIDKPTSYLERHCIDTGRLSKIVQHFSELKVVVLGDLIIDEYIFCDPLGMSQEDPTIVVTPIKQDLFVGGAGIVAAHAKSLGATVQYFGVVGNDTTANYAKQKLQEYGVDARLVVDQSRPTTLKRRFRTQGKTLLRVSELRQHNISQELQQQMVEAVFTSLSEADLVIFSDFSYGCLPLSLVNQVTDFCNQRNIPMVADSQSSSQIGDITRFKNMLLVTPTEREARLAIQDTHSGLMAIAEILQKKINAKHVFITLGSEGLLIYSPNDANLVHTDELPVLNHEPKDLVGAGDCLLTCSAMSLVAGANIWESAYLGSIAAACQVGRMGNIPLKPEELQRELID